MDEIVRLIMQIVRVPREIAEIILGMILGMSVIAYPEQFHSVLDQARLMTPNWRF